MRRPADVDVLLSAWREQPVSAFAISLRQEVLEVPPQDVITRGGRVQETIDIVRAAGAEVVAVAVLVDRSAGAAKFAYPTFSLLQMSPQVWEPAACPLCKQGLKYVHPGS